MLLNPLEVLPQVRPLVSKVIRHAPSRSGLAYQETIQDIGSTIALNYHDQLGTTWLAAGILDGDVGCCPDSHIMLNYKEPGLFPHTCNFFSGALLDIAEPSVVWLLHLTESTTLRRRGST